MGSEGKKSPSQWLDTLLEERGMAFLIEQFEGGGLASQPTLRDLSGPFSVRSTLQWMELLLAALDCYNTFIHLHMVKPHQILGMPRPLLAYAHSVVRRFRRELFTLKQTHNRKQ